MNSWTRGFTTYSSSRNRFHVTLWTQPWYRRAVAAVYHWYDMRVFKVPGFRRLERWLEHRHRGDDFYIPLSCQQDCRCHYLSERGKTELATFNIDEAMYDKLNGKTPL